ncbi:hypothetical protein [Clostridium perfringens]|uniref:hypothetical protein n=1 Tax=Clostridium perfringens TaxID=1502 RepID=UPI000DA2E6CA|nr:hypothetical protein [Clostridium perfringens]SQI03810.1 Uncharacterised protein [Clostridium perfringens]
MKKSDLKDGMIIEFRNIEEGLGVVINNLILFKDAYYCLDNFTENLENTHLKDLDVIKVYVLNAHVTMNEILSGKKELLKVMWERKKEIDWNKVPFGTKVVASDFEERLNREYIFVGYKEELEKYPFIVARVLEGEAVSFRYCKIHPDVDIKEEWYK